MGDIIVKDEGNKLANTECIVFDLDGTIVDSKTTIFKSVVHSLKKLGVEFDVTEKEFSKIIGHHFRDIFLKFDIDVPDPDKFYEYYKSVYFDFIDSSRLYPRFRETLRFFADKNLKSALLTTKLQSQADKILEYFELTEHFDYIMGRRPDLEIKPSPEPLLEICRILNVPPGRTLMIGDTEMDVQCGKNAGSFTCAVTFGYRTVHELNAENPDIVIGGYSELVNVFKKLIREQ